MADGRRITLQIRGTDEYNGDIRFDDFIKQLDSFRNALKEVGRIVSDKSPTHFKVVDLQHNSPALIVLEAISKNKEDDKSEAVVSKFFTSLDDIERGVVPSGFDFETFQSFKAMTGLLGQRVSEIKISRNGELKNLEPLSNNIDKILGPDRYEFGSLAGMLEQINIHASQNVFTIYPTHSRPFKLKCIFPKELRDQAISGIGHYVKVYGEMKFKAKLEGSHPYEIHVRKIEIYPPENELPTLSQLRGIAPNATGDLSSEEFIRGVRDEW